MTVIKVYRDGFRFLWWGLRVKIGWIRGLSLGVQHIPGPWRESKYTHSDLVFTFLVFEVRFQHAFTGTWTWKL